MTSEQISQRSDILGTQVITRDTGKRLGVVSQLWVDIDRREVVALGLRESILSMGNVPRLMLLSRVRQVGDVILVDDDSVLEDDVDVEIYNTLINCEVITETGEMLGRVRGFKFDNETGKVSSLIIASFGVPQIPDRIAGFETISTYELPIDEIVSSGPNRLIVFEGAEERLVQLTVGVMERLGIGKAPWEREEEEEYGRPTTIRPENQLPTGVPLQKAEPIRRAKPLAQETWDEDQWEEPAPRQPLRQAQPQPLRKMAPPPESIYYDEEDIEEEENWSDAAQTRNNYAKRAYAAPEPPPRYDNKKYEEEYDDEEEQDAWADDEAPKPYKAPKVNIPEKIKAPEYEEEDRY
ncbi:PRC-barrel domain-containing protein [Argonema galeatum]|uniref:PRC-barrel domain-containing protein n=1 Tax=Argonema galeatum TaxID=2942762 RepID=UPI002012BF6D|nr:PRC-barrel domain-containing protein [Argonema galeatum]MCL1465561.1 PRC-barrel domain-containing protein [Argonema galeatum A003/A1]